MAEKKPEKALVKCRNCDYRMGTFDDYWCLRAALKSEHEREPLDINKERECEWFEKRFFLGFNTSPVHMRIS